MSQLGDALELMHQARHRAPPFDITIESRSRRGTTLVRVRRADGRLRVDEAPEGDRGGPSTLVEADGRWLVTRADGTASTGEGATTWLFDGPWMPVVDLVIDPSPLLSQLTVTARFDPEFDADTFSTVAPAGSRITKVKSMWTVRTLAGMAVALSTPRKRLIARAERDRLARISARPPGDVGRGPQGWRQGSDDG